MAIAPVKHVPAPFSFETKEGAPVNQQTKPTSAYEPRPSLKKQQEMTHEERNAKPPSVPVTTPTPATAVQAPLIQPFSWTETEAAGAPLGTFAKLEEIQGTPIVVWSMTTAYSETFKTQDGDPVLMAEFGFSYLADYNRRAEHADRFLCSTSQWRIVIQAKAMYGSTRFPFAAMVHRLPDKNRYGNEQYQLGEIPPTISDSGKVVDALGNTTDFPA